MAFGVRMKWAFLLGILGLCAVGGRADARPPLGDPVSLNIGINCQWQRACMKTQSKAMKRALKFVREAQPPAWRVQLCNRNAGRQRVRVDWVGFDNCIRNSTLRPIPASAVKPPAPRSARKKVKRLTENAPAPPATARGPGERG
jgi:hypothetical protein